jgi:hypothetical protein
MSFPKINTIRALLLGIVILTQTAIYSRSQNKDTVIQQKQDSVKFQINEHEEGNKQNHVDSVTQDLIKETNESGLWKWLGRLAVLLGIIFGIAEKIPQKVILWYHLKYSAYLKTIIEKYKKYGIYNELEIEKYSVESSDKSTGSDVARQKLIEIVNKQNGIQVIGKPGSGKTTLLKKTFLRYAQRRANAHEGKIPIFIEHRNSDIFKQILHFLHLHNLVKESKYLTEDWLKNQLLKGKFVIFIDDVHKIITSPERKEISRIEELLDFRDRVVFILACRDYIKRNDFGFSLYKMSKLTDEMVTDILQNHTTDNNAEILSRQIKYDRLFRTLYDTPQMLELLAKSYEKNGRIPLNKSNMFSEFYGVLEENEQLKGSIYKIEVKKRLLSHIALSMFVDDQECFKTTEDKCLKTFTDGLNKMETIYGFGKISTVDILEELLKSGSLIRDDEYIRFQHDQWQEYFAALEIFNQKLSLKYYANLNSFPEIANFVAGFHKLGGSKDEKKYCQLFLEELIDIDFFLFSRCLKNYKSDIPYSLDELIDKIKVVFTEQNIKEAYGEFLAKYEQIIAHYFPSLRNRFEPGTECPIGIIVEMNEYNKYFWRSFFPLQSTLDERVVVVDQKEIAKKLNLVNIEKTLDYYHKQFSASHFKAIGGEPVLYKLPIIGAYREIKDQIKNIIERMRLCETIEMDQERLFYESRALLKRMRSGRNEMSVTPKDIDNNLRKRRIHDSIIAKYLNGTSVDVRGLNAEVDRLLEQGYNPERRKGSTTYAGIYHRNINDLEFEEMFDRFVNCTQWPTNKPLCPPIDISERKYLNEDLPEINPEQINNIIDWSRRYYLSVYNNYREMLDLNFPISKSSFKTYSKLPIVIALVLDEGRIKNQKSFGEKHVYGNVSTESSPINVICIRKEEFDDYNKKMLKFRWFYSPSYSLNTSYHPDEPLRNEVYKMILKEYEELIR